MALSESRIRWMWSEAHNDTSDRMAYQVLAGMVEAEVRSQTLSEAYDLLFDVKGCKATRFDAQNAIRGLAAPADVRAWIELARPRLEKQP